MKKIFVWFTTYFLLLFTSCIPPVLGGNIQKYYNYFLEVSLFWLISNKVVAWIFNDKKEVKKDVQNR